MSEPKSVENHNNGKGWRVAVNMDDKQLVLDCEHAEWLRNRLNVAIARIGDFER